MEVKNNINVWDKNVAIEESRYYWNDKPVIDKCSFTSSSKLKVAELFCGCGGLSKGFEMAGCDIILGADIHRPSIETFKYNHHNASTILGDLRKVTDDVLKNAIDNAKIDIMVAGVPCQGFSLNNRKRNENDSRNYLFKDFVRHVKALNPKVVVLENVSGMKAAKNGCFVESIKSELRDAGFRYVDCKMLNAADYGVPQVRNRLVFVGFRVPCAFTWPVVMYGPKTGKPYRTVLDAIGDLPMVKAGESTSEYVMKPFTKYQKEMRGKLNTLFNHEAPNHPQETILKIGSTKPGQPMYPAFRQRIRLSYNKPCPTQVSGGIRPQFQFGHPSIARGLTIRERCRIQSFPDNYVIMGGLVQGRVQTGNAVPPLMAKAIAKAIKKTLT